MPKRPVENEFPVPSQLSVAWPPFAKKLAQVLRKLNEDQFLILSVKRSTQCIQFAAQGSFGIRVETTSNNYLAMPEQLNKRQISALIDAGWHAPTGLPAKSTPENDPDGSPNYYFDFPARKSFRTLADMAVSTLAKILRVPYPGFLEYDLFDSAGNEMALPELGLKRSVRSMQAEQEAALPQLLLATIRELTGIADLDFDNDGDISIRYGSVAAFIRLMASPSHVRICSPLLTKVDDTPELLAHLNEINSGSNYLRYFVRDGVIFAVADVPAAPYVSDHVTHAMQDFCQITDGLNSLLQAEYGGQALFMEAMPSLRKH